MDRNCRWLKKLRRQVRTVGLASCEKVGPKYATNAPKKTSTMIVLPLSFGHSRHSVRKR